MGNTRNTGHLRNLISYDSSGNIVLPGNLTVTGSILANGGSVSYLPLSGGVITAVDNSGLKIKQGNQIGDAPSATNFYNGLVFENISTTNAFSVGYSQGAKFSLNYYDAASTYLRLLTVTNSGFVGIGLINPQSQLHITGDLTFTEAGYDTVRKHQIAHTHSDGSSVNNNIRFLVSDGGGTTAERFRINGLGNLLLGTTTDAGNRLEVQGIANNWAISATAHSTDSGSFGMIVRGGTNSNDVAFRVNNQANNLTYFTVNGQGNVGIGTNSPSQKLHIAGASNNIFLNEATSGNYAINRLKNSTYSVDMGVDGSGLYLDGATGSFRYYNGSSQRFVIGSDGAMGFNYPVLGSRSFMFRALSGRSLAVEIAEAGGIHSMYLRPVSSGRHLVSSNYLSGGVYLPLALSGRENDTDFVLSNGYVGIGTSSPDSGLNINSGSTRALRIDTNPGIQGISMNPNSIFGIDEPGVGNGRFIINTSGNVGVGITSPAARLHVVGPVAISNYSQTWRKVMTVHGQAGGYNQVKVIFNKRDWGSVTYDIKLASAGGSYHTAGAYYSNPGFSSHINSINAGNGPSMSLTAASPDGGTQGATWTFSGAYMIHPSVTVDISCGNGYQINPNDIIVEFS